jgi:hypothetical protein
MDILCDGMKVTRTQVNDALARLSCPSGVNGREAIGHIKLLVSAYKGDDAEIKRRVRESILRNANSTDRKIRNMSTKVLTKLARVEEEPLVNEALDMIEATCENLKATQKRLGKIMLEMAFQEIKLRSLLRKRSLQLLDPKAEEDKTVTKA